MKLSEIDKSLAKKLWHISGPASMGGDPEFFIANGKGKVLNADAYLPGKDNPIIVNSRSDYKSKLFFDGIQAEMAVAFNTCREYFADNIRYCWMEAMKKVPAGHKIVLKPAAKIQREVIEAADPEARRFGCAPDFNAYTRSINTPEMDASRHPFRYAGGHIHIGLSDTKYLEKADRYLKICSTEEGHLRTVKLFDLLVTIPTLLLDNGPGAVRRRAKYGKAGCFRPTPYGIEYRTPSCWWLRSPMTVSLVYGLARLAWTITAMGLDGDFFKAVKTDEQIVSGCINESDARTVKEIWENIRPYIAVIGYPSNNPLNIGAIRSDDYRSYVSDHYKGFYGPPTGLKGKLVYALAAYEYMLKHGLSAVIPYDIDHEWGLSNSDTWRNGFMGGSFAKLLGNKDFAKFQTSFLTNFFK
jgi:hypothetical protein